MLKMDLSKILAVSGKPGLYKMLTQGKSNFIVESLTEARRFPVFTHERVSSLEEISIFSTGDEDMPLKDVFRKVFDKLGGSRAPDANNPPDKLKAFFLDAVPEYDTERVYISDIKKVVTWYNLLLDKGLMVFEEEEKSESGDAGANPAAEGASGEDRPVKKASRKKDK